MKKVFAFLLCGLLCFGIVGCGSKGITIEDLEGYWKFPDGKIIFVENDEAFVLQDKEDSIGFIQNDGIVNFDSQDIRVEGSKNNLKWFQNNKSVNPEAMTKTDYVLYKTVRMKKMIF